METKRLLAYATGLCGQNMTYFFISGWLFYYLEHILRISSRVVGNITAVSRAWDAVNDPLIGGLVDKHKFKNGEKLRPLLLYTPVFIGIISAGMFMPSRLISGMSSTAMITVVCVFYLLWDVFYSFQDTALWGMVAVSSPDSAERARVSQWVSIGAGAGGVIAGLFPSVRGMIIAGDEGGKTDLWVFFGAAIVLGLGGELISMLAHKMKEAVESPRNEESLLKAIFVLRHNKKLLLISLARFFKDSTQSLLPAVYFFESRQNYNFGFVTLDPGTTQLVWGALTGAVGAVAMLFVTRLSEKVGGMKKILVIAKIFSICARTLCFFIGFNTPAQIFAVMGIMAISNIPTNMQDIAHRSLTSDSIDEVEYKTGERTEGISFSMQNFISKIATAVSLFFNGQILHKLGHDSNVKNYQQNSTYMKWQWPIFILGPAIGEILYLIVIMFIRDNKEERLRIEAELRERRKALEEKLGEAVV